MFIETPLRLIRTDDPTYLEKTQCFRTSLHYDTQPFKEKALGLVERAVDLCCPCPSLHLAFPTPQELRAFVPLTLSHF